MSLSWQGHSSFWHRCVLHVCHKIRCMPCISPHMTRISPHMTRISPHMTCISPHMTCIYFSKHSSLSVALHTAHSLTDRPLRHSLNDMDIGLHLRQTNKPNPLVLTNKQLSIKLIMHLFIRKFKYMERDFKSQLNLASARTRTHARTHTHTDTDTHTQSE